MHFHHIGHPDDAPNGCDVFHEIEIELLIKAGIGRTGRTHKQEGVTVRGSAHDGLHPDIGPGAGSVLDQKLLGQPLGKALRNQARDDVGRAARCKRHDDSHWPAG